jgi:hypothetical protein
VLTALAVLGVYLVLARLEDATARPAFRLASYLTFHLRTPVKPASVAGVFRGVFWIMQWALLPALLLPMFGGIVGQGWSGFRFRVRNRWYWLKTPALLLVAFWVPFKLYGWVPHAGSFGLEMTSFVLRILVAYLLFVAGWMLLVRETAK